MAALIPLTPVDFLKLREKHPDAAGVYYLRWLAQAGRDSFWIFLKDVLRNPVLHEPLHKPIADWLQHDKTKSKKLLLMARGHVKSNIFTVGYALWRAVRNRNIRILLDSHKDKDAAKFMRLIRGYVDSGWFQKVYPDIRPAREGTRKKLWNESQAVLERDADLVESTWEVSSITAEVTGRHYDLIVTDDTVTKDNVNTSELIEKTTAHHQLLESLLDPGGEKCDIGTRYHFSDEYGRILNDPELSQQYDTRIIPAVTDVRIWEAVLAGEIPWTRDLDFKALSYPLRFTMDTRDHVDPKDPAKNRKSLIGTRRTQGPTVFANQYMLEPFDPSDAVFDEDNIPIVDDLSTAIGRLDYYRFMDISSEVTTKDSFTAIWTIAVDERCNVFCVDLFHGNFDGTGIINELIRGQQVEDNVRPKFIGAEKGPYERSLKSFLERASREKEVWIPLRFLDGAQSNKPKDERIMGLEAWVDARKIHILRSCRNKDVAIEEFIRFPKFVRKDCIDALAQFPPLVFPNGTSAFLNDAPKPVEQPPRTGKTLNEIMDGMLARSRAESFIGADRVMDRAASVRFARTA